MMSRNWSVPSTSRTKVFGEVAVSPAGAKGARTVTLDSIEIHRSSPMRARLWPLTERCSITITVVPDLSSATFFDEVSELLLTVATFSIWYWAGAAIGIRDPSSNVIHISLSVPSAKFGVSRQLSPWTTISTTAHLACHPRSLFGPGQRLLLRLRLGASSFPVQQRLRQTASSYQLS